MFKGERWLVKDVGKRVHRSEVLVVEQIALLSRWEVAFPALVGKLRS